MENMEGGTKAIWPESYQKICPMWSRTSTRFVNFVLKQQKVYGGYSTTQQTRPLRIAMTF